MYGALQDGVQFNVKGSPRRVNLVQIVLTGDDLYTAVNWLATYKINRRALCADKIDAVYGIYADQLTEVLERVTGLYLSLSH